ncbi:MAG: sugar ABC transporter permease [Bacteroidota bacterium]
MKLRFASVKGEQQFWAWTFLGVPLLLLGIFVFFPIVFAFVVSFYDWNLLLPDKPFVGLANYVEVLQDEVFLKSVKNTIIYTIGVVPTQTFAALFLAFIMNQKIKGRTFFRIAFYVPAITSSVVTSIIFVWIYSKPGLFNYLLASVGIDSQIDWLTNPTTVLPSIMMLNVWTTSGFFMVSFLAGLQSIPQSLYEAAKIDGANAWQQFWQITVPMVRPITFFVMVMSLIGCFQVFDQIFIMSGGGPDNASTTMSYFVYQNSFKYFRFGFGAASAVVLAIIIFISTYLQKKYVPSEAY